MNHSFLEKLTSRFGKLLDVIKTKFSSAKFLQNVKQSGGGLKRAGGQGRRQFTLNTSKRIYFDHAAATPLDPEVKAIMEPFWTDLFYNPDGLSTESVTSKRALQTAKKRLAEGLGCRNQEILFTNSGTLSDNLAILGTLKHWQKNHPDQIPHMITTAIEHSAVRETIWQLTRQNQITSTVLEVDNRGLVQPQTLHAALTKNTILVSIGFANNEIGVIQPIKDLAKTIRRFKKDQDHTGPYPLLHSDAIQTINSEELDMRKLGVDLLTLSSAKCYGPKGIGVLIAKQPHLLAPFFYGGNQEQGLSTGTSNMPLIIGCTEAILKAQANRDAYTEQISRLRDVFFEKAKHVFLGLEINGDLEKRLPNNINISLPGISSELLVIELDAKGIIASAKSACKHDETKESHVIEALGDRKPGMGTVRLTLGRDSTLSDVHAAIEALRQIAEKYNLPLNAETYVDA